MALDLAAMGHLDVLDQTIDTSILAIKAQQAAERHQQQFNQIADGDVGGNGAGLAAPDGSGQPLTDDDDEPPVDPFKDNRILYNSIDRGMCYHAFAWMWCGCIEPKYKITASYAIGEEWESCCVRATDSMAYESVDDVRREQGCCWCCLSYSPCCPCFNDIANIVLLGGDASHADGWKLKRIHRSKEIYDSLTRIVQATNKSSKPK